LNGRPVPLSAEGSLDEAAAGILKRLFSHPSVKETTMSKSLFALIGLIGVMPVWAADRPDAATQIERAKPVHWPLKAGNVWRYQAMANGQQFPMQLQVAKIEVIDGQPLARLESRVQDKVVASEHLSLTDKGLFRHRYNGIEVSPAVQLLKYPIKDGESWDIDVKIGGESFKGTCKVGSDEVTVPAGKYKTVTILLEGKAGAGFDLKTTYWLAPGVGMVKQTAVVQGMNIQVELEKFEAAK
jgi:hypothetical protein